MNNIEDIKKIISTFIEKSPDEINENTFIDKRAVKGSILIHRMYAAIADAGIVISDYSDIKTFGNLLEKIGANNDSGANAINNIIPVSQPHNSLLKVGIDIEEVGNFNLVTDFREDAFYKQNFSPKEIAWCIMQVTPSVSFAGKFAAKEAIVKAENSFKKLPFNAIEILNNDEGKPYFMGFEISISHTENIAIAVAVSVSSGIEATLNQPEKSNQVNKTPIILWFFVFISILLAIISIFLKK